jgi:hypothetical protein
MREPLPNSSRRQRSLWIEALLQPMVWRRASIFGVAIKIIQPPKAVLTSLTPALSPRRGRINLHRCGNSSAFLKLDAIAARENFDARPDVSPSPGGEGWGEVGLSNLYATLNSLASKPKTHEAI